MLGGGVTGRWRMPCSGCSCSSPLGVGLVAPARCVGEPPLETSAAIARGDVRGGTEEMDDGGDVARGIPSEMGRDADARCRWVAVYRKVSVASLASGRDWYEATDRRPMRSVCETDGGANVDVRYVVLVLLAPDPPPSSSTASIVGGSDCSRRAARVASGVGGVICRRPVAYAPPGIVVGCSGHGGAKRVDGSTREVGPKKSNIRASIYTIHVNCVAYCMHMHMPHE